MAENKNEVLEIGKTAFSFFSLKMKMIIIGVAVGIFIIVIFPVVAIMSLFSGDDTDETENKSDESYSSSIVESEVIDNDFLKKYMNAKFIMPFETWDSNKDVVTSQFSPKRIITVNGKVQSRAHTGIDLVVISISNPKICSVLDGEVVVAKAETTGYGNYVVIEHNLEDDAKIYTLYGHMKEGSITVTKGEKVKTGQVLGIMGSTGNSTGPHLHFEVRLGVNSSSRAVNPYNYLFGD